MDRLTDYAGISWNPKIAMHQGLEEGREPGAEKLLGIQ